MEVANVAWVVEGGRCGSCSERFAAAVAAAFIWA